MEDKHGVNVETDADVRNEVFVEVKPFVNQVGGHTCVLEIDNETICKPYVEREVWFYQNVPEEMKQYIPRYFGEIDVLHDVTNGSRNLVARIPEHLIKENVHWQKWRGQAGVKTSPGAKTSPGSRRGRKKNYCDPPQNNGSLNKDIKNKYNQWSVKCLERQITRYGFWANNQPQKFIMLGNLVSDYKHPCMMDLKMGRRQYGDDSSEEKRKLLEKRCAASTSSSLGFRICGTQVYHCDEGKYAIHDKYYGRYLDKDGVSNEIMVFFFNGISHRNDVIRGIIEKLQKLQRILSNEKRLKLYSCSLLLIYDGILPRDQQEMTSPPAESDFNLQTSNDSAIKNKAWLSGNAFDAFSSDTTCSESKHIKFDVRLIDFAHVSETDTDIASDDAADSNIVFGLTKLIELLDNTLHKNVR